MEKVILLCSLWAFLVLGTQLALCLKSKKKMIKLLPLCIILFAYVTALMLCLVELLNGSGGVAILSIFAFILAIANTVALAADGAAWLIYRQLQKRKNRDSQAPLI